jgi:hypothetical protein
MIQEAEPTDRQRGENAYHYRLTTDDQFHREWNYTIAPNSSQAKLIVGSSDQLQMNP